MRCTNCQRTIRKKDRGKRGRCLLCTAEANSTRRGEATALAHRSFIAARKGKEEPLSAYVD